MSLSKSFEGESKFNYSQLGNCLDYADQLLHEKYIIVTYETVIWDQEHFGSVLLVTYLLLSLTRFTC